MSRLTNRDFLKETDFTSEDLIYLLDLAAALKKAKQEKREPKFLLDKNIVLLFEKDSTRTRCSFEVAAHDQGAHTTYLGPSGSQIGKKESMADTARVLAGFYDGIEYRGFGQSIVEELAKYAGVPVWNGLTNEFHPTQILADMLTIREHFGSLKGRKLVFLGDCRYNMANSLMIGCAKLGMHFVASGPEGYFPDPALIARCEAMLAAWGWPGALEIMLGQLVNLFRDGEAVRMSKRTGEMVTFSELIDEVGVDATRFLMLSRSSDQPIDFNIEVAKKKDASNPVYYVQYAHARICSLLRKAAGEEDARAAEEGTLSMEELAAKLAPADVDLSPLTADAELALMRKMADFEEFIDLAARDRAPFRLTHYAQDLAALFHQFYTECRVIGVEPEVQRARLAPAAMRKRDSHYFSFFENEK